MAFTKREQPDDRLTSIEIESMLVHCIRQADLFMLAKTELKPELFLKGVEAHYRLLWEVALALDKKEGLEFLCNPDGEAPFVTFYEEVQIWLQKHPDSLTPKQVSYLIGDGTLHDPGMVRCMFSPQKFNEKMARHRLTRFLNERAIQDELTNKLNRADGVLKDMIPLLRNLQDKAISIQQIGGDPVEIGIPENWTPKVIERIGTDISFVDTALSGGHVRGETMGVLGAYGSGKTSLAVQLLSHCSFSYQALAALEIEKTGVPHYPDECFLFHYEAVTEEIRQRLIASNATITHERVYLLKEHSSKEKGFQSYQDYEKTYFKGYFANGELPDGERERYIASSARLRVNTHIIDMSGRPDNPKLGTGYIDEIRFVVENKLRRLRQADMEEAAKNGHPCRPPRKTGVIIIDYAGICAKRHMGANNIPLTDMRHYVGNFGDTCRIQLAVPLDTPVWVFHQLSAASNAKTHHTKQHYTDAAEAKNFAENLNFCFALGTKEDDSGALLWTTSKARRAQIHLPPVLVQEGQFFRLKESTTHVYDSKSRSVMPRDVWEKTQSALKVKSLNEKPPATKPKAEAAPTTAPEAAGDSPDNYNENPVPLKDLANPANMAG